MKPGGLVLFARNPVLGRVKSRLAATVGPEKALDAYRQLLGHALEAALACPAVLYLFLSDFVEEDSAWVPPDFLQRIQQGTSLGERMSNALTEVLAQGHEKAVLVGCDLPDLTADILGEAFERLDDHDLVLGPARDGGYYLVGLKEPRPALFYGIDWSTPRVFSQTLEKTKAMGLSAHRLPILADIDDESDWIDWKAGRG